MATTKRKFKWVKITNKYGIKNWNEYELFIEGIPKRVALIQKLDTAHDYVAIVDFDKTGYNGRYMKKAYPYLIDAKKAVEKLYNLKR